MPEALTERRAEPTLQRRASETLSPSEHKPALQGVAEHGGIYTRFRDLAAAAGGQEPPPEQFSPIFDRPEFLHPVNDAQKARVVGALQEQFGNQYIQRVIAASAVARTLSPSSAPVQRSEAHQVSGGSPPPQPPISRSGGEPLDTATRAFMEPRFGHDFSGVRVHTDSPAQQAAKGWDAEAFTTGRDIYFSQGAYDPSSERGRGLMAHELAHVVQQGRGMVGAHTGVSRPEDSLERQADSMRDSALRGEMFPVVASGATPTVQRQENRATSPAAPPPVPAAGSPPAAAAGDGKFPMSFAGMTIALPIGELLGRAVPGGKLVVPDAILKKVPSIPAFKLSEVSLDLDENRTPIGGTVGVDLNIPPVEGQGSLTLDRTGDASGSVHAVFRSQKIPGLRETEIDAKVAKDEFSLDAGIDFDLPKVTGQLNYKYQGGRHSGKGKADYQGAKLKGSLEIIMSEAGRISGSGMLDMDLFKGLRGQAEVAVDEARHIQVKGKLSIPGQVELFPEKKYEKSFFTFEKKFPLWGITIPVIDVNVGLFAEIHASAGFRAKFGPGVLRDIALTGEFGTDPEAATEFGLGGEFFLPAGAEVVVNVGGGIGLGLAVADITGGIEAVGVAGLYSALTVRPQFKYAGGKYTISGMAELAGVAQLKLGINAFAKVDVGVWLFKGTVWRRDWNLAEWIWNTGLNVALRANISYTLGDDFAPDFSFETGQVDPEKLVRDVMPESGSPVPAPPKPAVPDKASLNAEGTAGAQAPGAPAGAAPPVPGAPAAQTRPGEGAPTPAAGAPEGAVPAAPQLPPAPAGLSKDPEERTEPEAWQTMEYVVVASTRAPAAAPVQRAARSQASRQAEYLSLDQAYEKFSAEHPGAGITRAGFDELNKNKYFDHTVGGTDVSAKFRPRKYTIEGDYKIPRKPGTEDPEPLIVPSTKAGTSHKSISTSGGTNDIASIVGLYKSAADSGRLVTFPRQPRPDMPALWDGYLKSGTVQTARDRDVRMDEVDHIIELQVGGDASAPSNLQLLNESDNGSSGGTIAGQARRNMKDLKTEKVMYKAVEQG